MADTIETVAVVGAGTMGTGIAVVSTRAGYHTVIHDVDEAGVTRGLDTVHRFLRKSAEKGKLTAEEAARARDAVSGTTRIEELASADVVIEAIHEDLATKQQLFTALDAVVSRDALLHTNTSTLPITSIAAGSKYPERVVGTHYCNPAPLMRLVEVARGRRTADPSYERSVAFLERVGKTTVTTADRPGFIVNRFLIPWENDVIRALESGLGTVESIDKAATGALGHPMGPFALLDIVGLDIHREVAMRLYEQFREPRFAPPPLVDQMIAAGDLGRKTGRGFYTYDDDRLFGT